MNFGMKLLIFFNLFFLFFLLNIKLNFIMCVVLNLWILICDYCVFEGWNLHLGHGFMPPKIIPACGTLMNSEEIYLLLLALLNGR